MRNALSLDKKGAFMGKRLLSDELLMAIGCAGD
ncbi:hypothetical protein ZBT109_0610 [Zymobacter palmae]|uniref:Uncharacterized protein n=1 Tax=Zymobacter palmae TaxID=33074 RepID=A0A348HCN6_9GAMM|nr:hypothetical protein ZBT109_0610 [Zymobacter palmae]